MKRLIEEGWDVVLYYANSNIFPQEENNKRFENLKKVADYFSVPLVRGLYDHGAWLSYIKGLEDEPEHGKRCEKCFEFNLAEASRVASEMGICHFTTTLTVSRFKKSSLVFETGKKYCGFEEIDFKKNDGFSKSVSMSKEMGLYRQQYCGCEFSQSNR